MKSKILFFIIGLIVGVIITVSGFIIFQNANHKNLDRRMNKTTQEMDNKKDNNNKEKTEPESSKSQNEKQNNHNSEQIENKEKQQNKKADTKQENTLDKDI